MARETFVVEPAVTLTPVCWTVDDPYVALTV